MRKGIAVPNGDGPKVRRAAAIPAEAIVQMKERSDLDTDEEVGDEPLVVDQSGSQGEAIGAMGPDLARVWREILFRPADSKLESKICAPNR